MVHYLICWKRCVKV